MGEIADSITEGSMCSLCGVYFEKEHGYPVVCKECYHELTKKEKEDYTLATNKEL